MGVKKVFVFTSLIVLYGLASAAVPDSASGRPAGSPDVVLSNSNQSKPLQGNSNPILTSANLRRSLPSSQNFNQKLPNTATDGRASQYPEGNRGTSSGKSKTSNVRGGQKTKPLSNYGYDNYVNGPRFGSAYAPLRRSFQSISYVHDQIPRTLIKHAGSLPSNRGKVPFRGATVTERTNKMAKSYFDEYEIHKKLTRLEERKKIFYGGDSKLMPVFKNMKKEQEALEKLRKQFGVFKTQRANRVMKKHSGK